MKERVSSIRDMWAGVKPSTASAALISDPSTKKLHAKPSKNVPYSQSCSLTSSL